MSTEVEATCEADCPRCAALACQTCESQGVSLADRPCFEHKWEARHQVAAGSLPAGSTPVARRGPSPPPPGKQPRCPGCGVPLTWDGWDESFLCKSGRHPGERRRAYVLGERGRLRPASQDADPTSDARRSKAEALEGLS